MREANRWLIYSALAVHLIGYGLWPYTWKDFFYQAAAIQAIILSALIVNLVRNTARQYDRWLLKGACMWLGWSAIILLKECCVFEVIDTLLDLNPTKYHAHEYILAFLVVVVCLVGATRLRRWYCVIRRMYGDIITYIGILVVFLCVITLISYHFILTRSHGRR